MERALRWDGILPHVGDGAVTPQVIADIRDWIGERRSLEGFEIVVEGTTPSDDPSGAADQVRQWTDAGATWWLESDWSNWEIGPMRRRIKAGPPRNPDDRTPRGRDSGPRF